MPRAPEPQVGGERDLLLGWLAFHRDALAAKCAGVGPEDLVRTGLGGSELSLLGLVRHLTEMERVYLCHAIGGEELQFVYGPYVDGEPERDIHGLDAGMVEASVAAWRAECGRADEVLARHPLDHARAPGGRTARANLLKVIQEYARHNGHADLIRQWIDGATGE